MLLLLLIPPSGPLPWTWSIPFPAHNDPKELAARRSRINNPEYRNITSVFI